MKELTVPRLELLSCLLLSKLVKVVIAAFTEELIYPEYCMLDRLGKYLITGFTPVQKEWQTWVENRVNHIRGNHTPEYLATCFQL